MKHIYLKILITGLIYLIAFSSVFAQENTDNICPKSGEMMVNCGYDSDPRNVLAYARQLRHAYAAATSYVDAQVGYLLEAFKYLGLNTIVVVNNDHGFALGGQNIWGKHSLYEVALKSPLIIQYPDTNKPGEVSDAIVETVDLFLTLTELIILPLPESLYGNSPIAQLDYPDVVEMLLE